VEVSASACSFAVGAPAWLMVRPERLELGAAEPPLAAPAMPVACTEVVFQGAVRRCALRDPSGGEVVAHLDASRAAAGIVAGARLWARWAPDAARLLRAEE
jgi:hypothetical protein